MSSWQKTPGSTFNWSKLSQYMYEIIFLLKMKDKDWAPWGLFGPFKSKEDPKAYSGYFFSLVFSHWFHVTKFAWNQILQSVSAFNRNRASFNKKLMFLIATFLYYKLNQFKINIWNYIIINLNIWAIWRPFPWDCTLSLQIFFKSNINESKCDL